MIWGMVTWAQLMEQEAWLLDNSLHMPGIAKVFP